MRREGCEKSQKHLPLPFSYSLFILSGSRNFFFDRIEEYHERRDGSIEFLCHDILPYFLYRLVQNGFKGGYCFLLSACCLLTYTPYALQKPSNSDYPVWIPGVGRNFVVRADKSQIHAYGVSPKLAYNLVRVYYVTTGF